VGESKYIVVPGKTAHRCVTLSRRMDPSASLRVGQGLRINSKSSMSFTNRSVWLSSWIRGQYDIGPWPTLIQFGKVFAPGDTRCYQMDHSLHRASQVAISRPCQLRSKALHIHIMIVYLHGVGIVLTIALIAVLHFSRNKGLCSMHRGLMTHCNALHVYIWKSLHAFHQESQ